MEFLGEALKYFLDLDTQLLLVVRQYGPWVYLILFLVIFAETGLVATPFLPGDSLLFATGAIAADGALSITLLLPLLTIAAILGDTVNYWIGSYLGEKVFERDHRFIKRKHLIRTREFYDRHGGKTIVIARFVPIVRTFAPFVAGVSKMRYSEFVTYNILGGILWVVSMTVSGYLFGGLPWVREHFEAVVLGIIFLSILPPIIEWLRSRGTAAHGSAD